MTNPLNGDENNRNTSRPTIILNVKNLAAMARRRKGTLSKVDLRWS